MNNFKKIFASFMLVAFCVSLQAEVKVNFTTEPALHEIGPDVTVVKMKFIMSQDGKPIDGNLRIVLDSPKKNAGLSTDFPIVEGTRLIDSEIQTVNGQFEMDYLFPIRGEYNMSLYASIDGKALAVQQESFTLNENPEEVTNFTFLALGLLVFGLISGLIIGRGASLKAQSSQDIELVTAEPVEA
jgi:hypothetical protein